jgi:hypothetical protein
MKKDRHGNECSKRLPVGIYTLAAVQSFDYFEAVSFAERLYGKHGIFFDIVTQMCMALDAEQQVRLAVIDGSCEWDQNNSEQAELHTLVSAPPGQVSVFIVGGIQQDTGPLAGCAGHAPTTPAAVVSGSVGTKFTLAHEVGHILLTSGYSPVHESVNTNIMIGGTHQIPINSSPDFNAAQLQKILAHPLLQSV